MTDKQKMIKTRDEYIELVKKELIEIEKRQVVIPDPVMKVWLKKELGI